MLISKTIELKSRQEPSVANGILTLGIHAESALNAELWDVDGMPSSQLEQAKTLSGICGLSCSPDWV